MRILALVTDAFGGRGGIAKFNRDLMTALCAHSEMKEVVALPRLLPEAPGDLPSKLNYVTAAAGGKLRYMRTAIKSAIAFRNAALRAPCSLLILCGHINLLPVAFLARSLLPAPCPVLLVIHGIDAWEPTRSWLANRLVRKVDALVSVSQFTRQRFLKWSQLDGVKHFILPNCVDLGQFTPGPKNAALLERYGLRERTVLLTLARLSSSERYKGVDEVLEALPELTRETPNLSYLIVGDGDDRERLMSKAKSLGYTVSTSGPVVRSSVGPVVPQVIFAGYVPEREKADHYRLADAFVMPGSGEGFGIVFLEALACGIPVVGSKVDGSREALRDGRLGILVDPSNPDELKAGIRAALQKGRSQAVDGIEYFSYDNFVSRCHAMLDAVAGERLRAHDTSS